MTIAQVITKWDEETGGLTEDGQRQYQIVQQVRSTRGTVDGAFTVSRAVDPSNPGQWARRVPQRYVDVYYDDSEAVCVNVNCRRMDPENWRVTSQFSTAPDEVSGGELPGSQPFQTRVKRSFATGTRTRDAYTGYLTSNATERVPIVNTAEESMPAIPEEYFTIVWTYVRNERQFNPEIAEKFANRLNSAKVGSYETPLTVLCSSIAGEEDSQAGIDFVRVTYQFEVNPEKWLEKIPNVGTVGKRTTSQEDIDAGVVDGVTKLTDQFGRPVRSSFLDDAGFPTSTPTIINPPDGIRLKGLADFQELNLPFV